jgi:hypothetical protein
MALLDEEYKTDSLPKQSSFDPIPEAKYPFEIHGAEVKKTKDGHGKYISLQCAVLGGPYNARIIFSSITLKNANEKAVEIGQQQLGSLLRAAGLAVLKDTDQLLGKRFEGKVKIKKSQGYDDKNEISSYAALPGAAAPMPMSAATAPAETKPAGSTPWSNFKA